MNTRFIRNALLSGVIFASFGIAGTAEAQAACDSLCQTCYDQALQLAAACEGSGGGQECIDYLNEMYYYCSTQE